MHQKRTRKGFTLVEMLVVIAIIAVLVAITIPTVTSHTTKAAAAANAANLRSVYGQIVSEKLSNPDAFKGFLNRKYLQGTNGQFTFGDLTIDAPPAKGLKTNNMTLTEGTIMQAYITEDSTYVFYVTPGYEYMYFAEIAENGTAVICTGYKPSNGLGSDCANCGRGFGEHIVDNVVGGTCGQGKHSDLLPPYCICDICKAPLDHNYGDNGKCKKCGKVNPDYTPEPTEDPDSKPVHKHVDNNNDYKCDDANCPYIFPHIYERKSLLNPVCKHCGKLKSNKEVHI